MLARPMPPAVPELLAARHPILGALLFLAGGAYVLAVVLAAARPALARPVVAAGAAIHLAGMAGRGAVIGFFPLIDKAESFSTAALAIAVVALVAWHASRLYLLPLLGSAVAVMCAALASRLDLAYPPPLMRTIWYPLHVPLSFLAYGAWAAAAAGALAWVVTRDGAWLVRIDRLALWGFGLWTLAMVFGGVWGVVAWGAYFLWDPKVVWSVILWFHYATFLHVKYAPSLQARAWVRPALAAAGLLFVAVAFVGTSFLYGRSSHAF
jgi:ABC-type transport system involved in cytochrome c biogenesis permease subunit